MGRRTYVSVYRVEHHHSGEGPWSYRSSSWGGFGEWRGHNPSYLPAPEQEGIFIATCEVCATRSLAQLRKWFWKGHLQALHKGGFVLRKYRVPKDAVKFGRKQVVAQRDRLELVEEWSCLRAVRA